MSNVHFSTSAYVQLHVLKGGHSRNVNCVAFSPDGAHLASGGDDQALSIWHISQGRLLYRLLFKSAVDTILWHPVHPDTVIVGCANGTLQQVHDFSDLLLTEQYDINLGARTTVHCLDYDATTQRLAIGMGEEVHLTKEHSRNRYHGDLVFPSPPEPEGFSSTGDRRLRPISLHFDQNGSVLIVSYLAHGIVCWDATKRTQLWCIVMPRSKPNIGGAALSPDRSRFAVYNCVDGLDVYPVGPYKKQSPLMSFKFPRAPQSRHGLNVSYVHRGHGLMSGTTTGSVCLWETQTGDLWQALPHDEDIIPAVAAAMQGKTCYVAAGSAGKGQETYIKIWKAKIVHEKDTVDIGDTVVDIVQAVTRRPFNLIGDRLVRSAIPWAVALLVFLCSFWIGCRVPWERVWDTACYVVHSAVSAIQDVVAGLLQAVHALSSELSVLGASLGLWIRATVVEAARDALRKWLFPELEFENVVIPQAHTDL